MTLPAYIRESPGGVTIAVKVQPRASANEICGVAGEELRLKVTSPPVDSAANEMVVRFLAEVLKCPKGRVELVRGGSSRHKLIKVHGASAQQTLAALATRM